eukprot:bmy_09043T0
MRSDLRMHHPRVIRGMGLRQVNHTTPGSRKHCTQPLMLQRPENPSPFPKVTEFISTIKQNEALPSRTTRCHMEGVRQSPRERQDWQRM